jgi:predicted GH43/DUF377 family glycosyl hydrolase
MSGPPELAHRIEAALRPDPARVIARLFLPGEYVSGQSRVGRVAARVLALQDSEVEQIADQLLADFSGRHRQFPAMLDLHAAMISSHLPPGTVLNAARRLVLGATFTAEYATESAALCNPSAVLHPDQSGVQPGQARVAVSLRGIGEGHVSSITFASALVGPGPQWSFEPRLIPAYSGVSTATQWRREHLRAVLADQGPIADLAHDVLSRLPDSFTAATLHQVLSESQPDLRASKGSAATAALLARLVDTAYRITFPPDVTLSQRVLLPQIAEESNGMEDARFVRYVGDDGHVDYRATYTAYNGHHIAPRLLTSPDLQTFTAHRLGGPAARNKGMALFPRPANGRHLSLCRSDGESNWLSSSPDGLIWDAPQPIEADTPSWALLQVGNCGPPIETAAGWLVLTHGVGPMRTYAIGAMLLDLDDPRQVLGQLERPLLHLDPGERDGYVPNVVYSCGGILHDGRLWLPYGIGDARIAVAWAALDELLAAMTSR